MYWNLIGDRESNTRAYAKVERQRINAALWQRRQRLRFVLYLHGASVAPPSKERHEGQQDQELCLKNQREGKTRRDRRCRRPHLDPVSHFCHASVHNSRVKGFLRGFQITREGMPLEIFWLNPILSTIFASP